MMIKKAANGFMVVVQAFVNERTREVSAAVYLSQYVIISPAACS